MPCAAIAAQHAHGQIDLPPPFGSGQPHAYETIVHGGHETVVERQMQHASTVREPHAECVERIRRAETRATESTARGPVHEGHAATVQRQSDAVRVEQFGELSDAVRPGRIEIDQDAQPLFDAHAPRRRIQFAHVRAHARGRDDRGLDSELPPAALVGRMPHRFEHLIVFHGGFDLRVLQYGKALTTA